MAKVLTFEGCPACERKGGMADLGFAGSLGDVTAYATDAVKGGAIGAGGVIIVDMILPKILPNLSPLVRTLVTGAALIGGAYAMKKNYPQLAEGVAVGGGSIVMYKLIKSILGNVIPTQAEPLKGLAGLGEWQSNEVEMDDGDAYGVLVPEQYGQEEIILE